MNSDFPQRVLHGALEGLVLVLFDFLLLRNRNFWYHDHVFYAVINFIDIVRWTLRLAKPQCTAAKEIWELQ